MIVCDHRAQCAEHCECEPCWVFRREGVCLDCDAEEREWWEEATNFNGN